MGSQIGIDKIYPVEHDAKPPSRLSVATLISTMKKHGIGRPSTYANIVNDLERKEYITTAGKVQTITVTEKGLFVIDLIEQAFPQLIDLKFTAMMEQELDLIAKGKKKRLEVSKQFFESLPREAQDIGQSGK